MVAHPGTVSNPAEAPRIRALADGAEVQLSLIGPADRRDLLTGMDGLSAHSRYLRFFSYMPTLPRVILDGLVNTDGHDHVAIGARLVAEYGRVLSPIVGVARYYRSEDDAHIAEPAVAVVDPLHGRGLGKLLLRALGGHARAHGISHFRAHALANNDRVRQILRAANGTIVDHDGPVLVYDVDIRRQSDRSGRRGVLARLLRALLRQE